MDMNILSEIQKFNADSKINKLYLMYKNNSLLDKWNMIDVFIVALLLVNFKMGDSLIVMELQLGTAFLSISVITRILVIELIDRWIKDNDKIINKQL